MALERFVAAQDRTYADALAELTDGNKRSHWMWFIFPQIAGLGQSQMARTYAIVDGAEAEAYLAHPLLGARLAECTDAMLGWTGQRDAATILGGIDAVKFRSSMTLFEAVSSEDRFSSAIEAYYAGERDERTLALLDA